MTRTITPCLIEGCPELSGMPGTAKGYCNKHYTRFRRHGNAEIVKAVVNASLQEHFDHYATHRPKDGCWIWQGYFDPSGYGIMHRNGKTVRASRAAYELFVGPLADTEMARHTCDNPPCCNPKHLLSGSALDNSRDMWERGRAVILSGEQHPQSKLTVRDVKIIRDISGQGLYSQTFIAHWFGVSSATVWSIKHYKTWAGVQAA